MLKTTSNNKIWIFHFINRHLRLVPLRTISAGCSDTLMSDRRCDIFLTKRSNLNVYEISIDL